MPLSIFLFFEWDTELFFVINQMHLPSLMNNMLVQWRNALVWIPLYLLLISYLIWAYKKKGVLLVILAIICSGLSDFSNSSLLKKSFERPRPCKTFQDSEQLVLKVRCGSGYSFPSSHASNHMALALFLFLSVPEVLRRWFLFLIPWAFLVGFAQVYVGVHYPFDVLIGFLWGAMLALAFSRIHRKIVPFFDK